MFKRAYMMEDDLYNQGDRHSGVVDTGTLLSPSVHLGVAYDLASYLEG